MESFITSAGNGFVLNIPVFLKYLEEILEEEMPRELYLRDVTYFQAVDYFAESLKDSIKNAVNYAIIEE